MIGPKMIGSLRKNVDSLTEQFFESVSHVNVFVSLMFKYLWPSNKSLRFLVIFKIGAVTHVFVVAGGGGGGGCLPSIQIPDTCTRSYWNLREASQIIYTPM